MVGRLRSGRLTFCARKSRGVSRPEAAGAGSDYRDHPNVLPFQPQLPAGKSMNVM